ncbi:MAG: hypothetical protein PHR32_00845 [Candidatus Cloacimonetes bacterium]|nr:hypothetical protein [Candidatus Cloacimonadota bacterium]
MSQKLTITVLLLIVGALIIIGIVADKIERANEPDPRETARQDSIRAFDEAQDESLRLFQIAMAESMRVAKAKELIVDYKSAIKVLNVYPSKPNSANGVDAHTVWQNKSDKVVKYATFSWTPYNAVGDVVGCQIRGFRRAAGTVTGPINPGQTHGYNYSWSCMWYNNTIRKLKLRSISIEYMDGSEIEIPEEYIELVYKKQD